jgi:hypothetical protein
MPVSSDIGKGFILVCPRMVFNNVLLELKTVSCKQKVFKTLFSLDTMFRPTSLLTPKDLIIWLANLLTLGTPHEDYIPETWRVY